MHGDCGIRRSRCCTRLPRRCWPGLARSSRSASGSRMPRNMCWASSVSRPIRSPGCGRCRTPRRCAVCCGALDGDALDAAIARICRPERRPSRSRRRAGAAGDRGRRQSGTRLAHPDRHGDPAAGRDGRPRRGHGPAAGRLEEQRGPFLPSFASLLDSLDLQKAVVTADAPHTQRDHGTYLKSRGAHNLAVVKKNIRACMPRSKGCLGGRSRSGTTPATMPTTATRSAGSKPPSSATSTTPEPVRRSKSCAGAAR